jgi:cytochrome P450
MGAPLQMEDFKDNFNPFTALYEIADEGRIIDPFPELMKLRSQSPVIEKDLHEEFGLHRSVFIGSQPIFMVLGFDEASEVLQNQADFSNTVYDASLGVVFGKTITAMDPPEHTKYRKLFQSAFTPKMLNGLKPRFQLVIDRLVDGLIANKKADLVKEFAVQFPFQFVCDLMNLPMEHRPLFHKIAHAQACVAFDMAHSKEASEILGRYLTQLIDQRRALKDDNDFMSFLANVDIEGEKLPQIVLVSFFRQLMNAGGDTSYHGFSNILAALFNHPEQFEAIRKDRTLLPQAIEEGLRWNGPLMAIQRSPSKTLVLGGVELPKGSFLHVCIATANRDPARWPEPDKFNIFREQKRHVALGFGPHICVGQHLAKLELNMALNALLDRLPNLRLDPASAPPTIRGLSMRGADACNVIWD